MNDLEQRIIAIISVNFGRGKKKELEPLFKQWLEQPVGESSSEFLNNKSLIACIENKFFNLNYPGVKLKVFIERYLITKDVQSKEKCYSELAAEVKNLREKTYAPHGQGLLPADINPVLIRNIYLSNDKELIELFLKNLPMPSLELFSGHEVPPMIMQRTAEATKAVLKFLEGRALSSVERPILKIQRNFRAKRRQKEELLPPSDTI